MNEVLDDAAAYRVSVPLRRFAEMRPERYGSEQALIWEVRQNRRVLLDAGALMLVRGRTHIVPERFEAVMAKVALAAARRRAGLVAAEA